MSTRRIAFVAALAAAGLALSACDNSRGVPDAGSASTQVTAAVDDAKATTIAMPAAPAAPASADGPWVDAPWKGQINRNVRGAQYGAVAEPGVVIAQHQIAGGSPPCSIGPAVTAAGGDGFLTAGHCDETPAGEVFLVVDQEAKTTQLLGEFSKTSDKKFTETSTGLVEDFTVLSTGVQPSATRIAGHYPIAGVMTSAAIKRLPSKTTPVCIDGAYTGVACGSLIDPDDQGVIRIALERKAGDSGGAVFLLDSENRAILIGLIKGGAADGSSVTATYLEPALRGLDLKALRNPDTSPAAGSDYSDLVTIA